MEDKKLKQSQSYKDTIKIINEAVNRKNKEIKVESKTFVSRFKLFLYIKKGIKRYISLFKNKVRKFFSLISGKLKTRDAKEIQVTIKFVIGYGLLIWTILYTFFDYKFNIIYIFGAGSLLYVFYDVFDYIVTKLRGKPQ